MSARNQRSADAGVYRYLYGTARWQRTRARQLIVQPLCERCLDRCRVVAASVCHHVFPDMKLSPDTFFAGPFESLCQPCHDGPVQQGERTGYSTEVGADGWPTDERHPANRG